MNSKQLKQLENDLWSAADNLRANTDLKSTEYARLTRTDKTIPSQLLKTFSNIPANASLRQAVSRKPGYSISAGDGTMI